MCSPNVYACKDVLNPNISIFLPNCAKFFHCNAFHYSINYNYYYSFANTAVACYPYTNKNEKTFKNEQRSRDAAAKKELIQVE